VRVVFDGHPLLPPLVGIGHYTYELIRALARVDASTEYVILYPQSVKPFTMVSPPELLEPNVRLARQGWWASMNARVWRRLGRGVPVEHLVGRADVFHATNSVFGYSVRAAKRVITIHDLTLVLFPEWHPAERLRKMGRWLVASARRADHMLVDSMSTKNDLMKCMSVGAERITVVPLAASAAFRPLPTAHVEPVLGTYGLGCGAYVLFVGTIEPRKNLLRLLEAMEIAGGSIGPLVVAGADGWGNQEIRDRMARLHRAGRMRYLGYVPAAALPALMNGARAFVYPSLYEGFGLPLLEAMACGTPVVASNASSLPEVVGAAGLLVDPHDPEALAGAIRRVWGDEDLRGELRARGLERASQFSWERTARLTFEVYRNVMAG
jgi:alpha-1,3-rhamnosyl/mannosyltransferase